MSDETTTSGKFDLPLDVAHGKYANLTNVTHSKNTFVFDFAITMPGMAKAVIHSRVLLAPDDARSFLTKLQENIDVYDEQYCTSTETQTEETVEPAAESGSDESLEETETPGEEETEAGNDTETN